MKEVVDISREIRFKSASHEWLFQQLKDAMFEYVRSKEIGIKYFLSRRTNYNTAIRAAVTNIVHAHFKNIFSTPDLAKLIGKKTHCTVLFYLKNHTINYTQWPMYRTVYDELKEVLLDIHNPFIGTINYDNIPQY